SGPGGEWRVNANGYHLALSITTQNAQLTARLRYDGNVELLDNATWDSRSHLLQFRRPLNGLTQWYRGGIGEGVLVGRFSQTFVNSDGKPTDLSAYKWRITGWNLDYLSPPNGPMVFDIVANGFRGRLRLDSLSGREKIGRVKFYAFENSLLEF